MKPTDSAEQTETTLLRALFHFGWVGLPSYAAGWACRLHQYYGSFPFTIALLLVPFALPGLRRRYKLGLLMPVLLFFLLGYNRPLWFPTTEHVTPIGHGRASLTVNGITPATFAENGMSAVLPQPQGAAIELRSLYILLSFGYVRLAVDSDGLILDSRLRITGDIGLAKPWKERAAYAGDGTLLGQSLDAGLQSLKELSENPLPEPILGKAWLAETADGPVVVYQDDQLAVYGNSIFQNTSCLVSGTAPFPEFLKSQLKYSYSNGSSMYYEDYRFQNHGQQNGRVYVNSEDETIGRVWAVYP